MFGLLFDLANFAISVCLPLVGTFKAIRAYEQSSSPFLSSSTSTDLKPWLIYWLVFGLLSTVEARVGFILYYLPLFGLIRVYISLWLILPQTKGAEYIYYTYINPFMTEHEDKVEQMAQCVNPRELIRVVSQYLGVQANLSRFSTSLGQHNATTTTSHPSYLDQFVDSFTKTSPIQSLSQSAKNFAASASSATNPPPSSSSLVGQGGLVESLLGVFKAVPLRSSTNAGASNVSTPLATPQKSFDSLKSIDSSPSIGKTSSSEGSDFDVVGKEDLVNFVENVIGTTGLAPELNAIAGSSTSSDEPQSSGWFSAWAWSQNKTKTKSKTA